jgi:glycosyltransferase involved in cell wall biosynthesis
VLVDACAALRRRGVPFEAAIVGQEDKHSDAVKERIAGHGLEGQVLLPGPMGQDELLREYRRASALCVPSRLLPDDRDGIPNVLVEAMAAGTPVIASAVSGIPELVEHEVNGLLVEPEDPEALADTLLRLHEDPALGRALADSGRETVERRFDGPRQAVRLAELFRAAVRT